MRRVLLKVSGEFFSTQKLIDNLFYIASQLKEVEVQFVIVVGGGNIFRGKDANKLGISRVKVDQMGMIATAINGLALQGILKKSGIQSLVFSSFSIGSMIKRFNIDDALRSLEEGNSLVLVGGTSHPYFSTDSAGAIYAIQTECEILLKGTKVDGVYDKDPLKHEDAVKLDRITYKDFLNRGLQVMDMAAVSLCSDNNLPICVFNLWEEGAIKKAALGEKIGTLIE